jgi:hypothetical protein
MVLWGLELMSEMLLLIPMPIWARHMLSMSLDFPPILPKEISQHYLLEEPNSQEGIYPK